MQELAAISWRLSREVSVLRFSEPIECVYNPLEYAWDVHAAYLSTYGGTPGVTLLVGMNPGPFGMAQTGVPFGDVECVRDWMRLGGQVNKPTLEHEKRPVLGFACRRREVSGSRLWGWAKSRFGAPEQFFRRFFVVNYCPLSFMDSGGRNITPDRLPALERAQLFEPCDRALRAFVERLAPSLVIGVGGFAQQRAREALAATRIPIGTILHPSPANPRANRAWAQEIEGQLQALNVAGPWDA
jgi:single-strand selective monofunctional uracil DNA glycosylase